MILLAKSDHLEEMPDRKCQILPQAILASVLSFAHIYINKLWFSGLRDVYTDRQCCGSITEEILMNYMLGLE